MQNIQMTAGSGPSTPEADKTLNTLQARAPECGCSLIKLEADTSLLSRWGLSKEFPSTVSVEGALRQMGGCDE